MLYFILPLFMLLCSVYPVGAYIEYKYTKQFDKFIERI